MGCPSIPLHCSWIPRSLFEFASPFHDTYPPFGHIAYWYEGYHHFWSPKYQATAIVRNLYYLVLLLMKQPDYLRNPGHNLSPLACLSIQKLLDSRT